MNKTRSDAPNDRHFPGPASRSELDDLLSLKFGTSVTDVVSSVLLKPLGDLAMRPGKKIRGRLVELGFQLADNDADSSPQTEVACHRLMEAVEFLHAGSLAIDDVQDGSKVRRGQPSLHLKYGLPIALNIGNWLYFWPLEIMSRLGLTAEQELRLYKIYHRTLLRAHLGQALDVGVPIDTLAQSRVFDVCLSTMELKSGALFALALLVGAVVGEAADELLDAIDTFGHGFGIGLQMFDDLGNVKGAIEPAKRWEDLILRRPTWVWACAAKYYSEGVYSQFVLAAHQLPHDHHPLETWYDQHAFEKKAKQLAHEHIKRCFGDFERKLLSFDRHSQALIKLRDLGMEIARAYE